MSAASKSPKSRKSKSKAGRTRSGRSTSDNGAGPAPKQRKPAKRGSSNGKPGAGGGQSRKEAGDANTTRGMGRGGQRLADAMDTAATIPALSESVARLERLIEKGTPAVGELADVVESDAALAISVLRLANASGPRAKAASVPDALEMVELDELRGLAAGHPTYEFFRPSGGWGQLPEDFRRHSLATRHAAERIADLGSVPGRDELAAAALLHDVGGLVLAHLYPAYEELIGDRRLTPEERVGRERRELGVDHALVGGVLLRRWKIPQVVATAVERHHNDRADGLAAAVRLADMLAHHAHGDAVNPAVIEEMAERCSLTGERLQRVLYEFPYSRQARQRPSEPCPLSGREVDALRGLAEGKVYKEIAEEMGLSASTVRTHLHNVYRKIGAADRAQAVLLARERSWI